MLKMGGAAGKVVSSAGRSGGKVGVRVGSMTVELRLSDLAPAGTSGAAGQLAAGGAVRRRTKGDSIGSVSSLKAAAKQLRARGTLSSTDDGEGGAATTYVAVQTSANTIDLRGRQADDAAAEVRAAVLSAPPGYALFVVHGVGTGRVRDEVLKTLKRLPNVARLEKEEKSNGGCTIAYIR